MGNINEHISTNINTSKYIKGSMVKLYPYSTKRDKTIVVILHIDVSRAIFLIFNDYQETESG